MWTSRCLVKIKTFQCFTFLAILQQSCTEIPPATETQHAICKVFTNDIEATAKATTTRELKGVCTDYSLISKFNILYEEIQAIKKLIEQSILSSNAADSPAGNDYETFSVSTTMNSDYEHNYNTDPPISKYRVEDEIDSLNNSIIASSDGKLFFYFWNINHFKDMLQRKDSYITSPDFSVFGHSMHLRFYPNYLNHHIGFMLKPTSKSFIKKHKISILGRNNVIQMEISSSLLHNLNNEDKVFIIKTTMIDANFISHDSLLVKIQIYLNS
ncbi:hypothetical protein ABEB36_004663 [Hypothenemus hampei]|uniref:MATH domain-containing protein n=1 Tax=Hypothenemus hampei TaxID=57062 RepID=A0ABD1F4D8_HYPHA